MNSAKGLTAGCGPSDESASAVADSLSNTLVPVSADEPGCERDPSSSEDPERDPSSSEELESCSNSALTLL